MAEKIQWVPEDEFPKRPPKIQNPKDVVPQAEIDAALQKNKLNASSPSARALQLGKKQYERAIERDKRAEERLQHDN